MIFQRQETFVSSASSLLISLNVAGLWFNSCTEGVLVTPPALNVVDPLKKHQQKVRFKDSSRGHILIKTTFSYHHDVIYGIHCEALEMFGTFA